MASITVIEISTVLKDETEAGRKSIESNLSKLEASVQKTQGILENLQEILLIPVNLELEGQDSFGVESLLELVEKFSGSTSSVVVDCVDLVTEPFLEVLDLVKNPISQFVSLVGEDLSGFSDGLSTSGDENSEKSTGISGFSMNSGIFGLVHGTEQEIVSGNSEFSINLDRLGLLNPLEQEIVIENSGFHMSLDSFGILNGSEQEKVAANSGISFNLGSLGLFNSSESENISGISGNENASSNFLDFGQSNSSETLNLSGILENFNSMISSQSIFEEMNDVKKESYFSEKIASENGISSEKQSESSIFSSLTSNLEKVWEMGTNLVTSLFPETEGSGTLGTVTERISSLFSGDSIYENSTDRINSEENQGISVTSMENIQELQREISETTGEVVTLGESMVETSLEGKTLLEESLSDFFDIVIPERMTQLWQSLGESLQEMGELALEGILEPMTEFFDVVLPESMSEIWEMAVESLETSKETALEGLESSTLEFFSLYIPETVQTLWDSASLSMAEQVLMAENTVNSGIAQFFVTEIPKNLQKIWDSGKNTLSSSSATATGLVNAGITSFFSAATSSVSSFFSTAQSKVNSAMSTANAAISSLSLSVSGISASISGGTGSGTTFSAYATGGILSSPHLGLVAEDGPEAIIPLSGKRRARGIALWEQAGELLGVKQYAQGGVIGGESSLSLFYSGDFDQDSSSFSVFSSDFRGGNERNQINSGISLPVSVGDIHFTVNLEGNTENMDVITTIRSHLGELSDEIAGEISKSLSQVFSNMSMSM